MASGTKRKRNTAKKKTGESAGSNTGIRREIIILLMLAVCILLLISNFGFGGFIGDFISSLMFGIFGLVAYIAPILIFVGIAFGMLNRKNLRAYIKIFSGVVLTATGCALLQFITNTYDATATLSYYYQTASSTRGTGGVLGGLVVRLLGPAVGLVGTCVLLVVIGIICIIIITERSILKPLKSGGEKVYSSAREDARRRKEEAEVRKEQRAKEKEQLREQQKAAGVTFNTTLLKKSPEVKELKAPEPPLADPLSAPLTAPEPAAEVPSPLEELVINRATPVEESVPDEMDAPVILEEPSPKRRKTKESAKAVAEETQNIEMSIERAIQVDKPEYQLPPLSLLKKGKASGGDTNAQLMETATKLQQTLKNFGVNVTITNVSCGPSVTRYELQPEQGVKVSKIVGLADDIKLNLAAADIRIEAPIPGKAAVGIEVPNKENSAVMLRDLLETKEFKESTSNLAFAAGKDIAGKAVITDIKKMPHVLIAGATGSGKSVCINTLIMSILYKANPDDVKLIMIDPKVVELSVYNGIPHLMIPVVTDPKKAAGALNWAVTEMSRRYQLFAEYNVRDLKGYNDKVAAIEAIEDENKPKKEPQIVIIVDELADLMMVAPGDVEEAICRLAQLARAAGLHLVLATQRPSVNVITGLIKANMPSRIAFSVSSGVDSRTIIDMNGAEKLLGKGDMLFYPAGYQKPARVQGAFVSDKEVQSVVEYLVKHNEGGYDETIEQQVNTSIGSGSGSMKDAADADDKDVYFRDAGIFIIEKDKASIGMLQRVFKIGFNRAARIMDQLCEAGVVGEEEGTKPRKVLMSMEQFEQYLEESV